MTSQEKVNLPEVRHFSPLLPLIGGSNRIFCIHCLKKKTKKKKKKKNKKKRHVLFFPAFFFPIKDNRSFLLSFLEKDITEMSCYFALNKR